jgi:omega-6 fatty acid desaturase (delta-12 desaturase)
MSASSNPEAENSGPRSWYRELKRYETPSRPRSVLQILTTLVPYAVLWYLMFRAYSRSYLLVLPLLIPAALLVVRSFILFHDCTHGSLFASRRTNAIAGTLLGVLSFTPYADWRRKHAMHHATVANLDADEIGDVPIMTVAEYRSAPPARRFLYRLVRHPAFLFLVRYRWPATELDPPEWKSVLLTDLLIALYAFGMSLPAGLPAFLAIQLPVFYISTVIGFWLFYVQHNFRPGYRRRAAEWDRFDAAFLGSSFYRLPGLLNWFTASIGYHHLHHIRPRIPNYRLRECYRERPEVQVTPLTFRRSLESLTVRLWDEERGSHVSFREARL